MRRQTPTAHRQMRSPGTTPALRAEAPLLLSGRAVPEFCGIRISREGLLLASSVHLVPLYSRPMQHFLNFFPDPQGQGSFRPTGEVPGALRIGTPFTPPPGLSRSR